jgi:hypothetical protein
VRLTDLNPKWIALEENGDALGVTFLCPHCRQAHVGVYFAEPVDTNGVPGIDPSLPLFIAQHPENLYWHRAGDSFDTLTLTPSVDVSKHGHWHGFVTGGEIT